MKFCNNTIQAEQDKKGNWIYKSLNVPFKMNGALKKEFKDLPRYKVIQQYEDNYQKDYQKEVINESVKKIVEQMLKF